MENVKIERFVWGFSLELGDHMSLAIINTVELSDSTAFQTSHWLLRRKEKLLLVLASSCFMKWEEKSWRDWDGDEWGDKKWRDVDKRKEWRMRMWGGNRKLNRKQIKVKLRESCRGVKTPKAIKRPRTWRRAEWDIAAQPIRWLHSDNSSLAISQRNR